MSIPHHQQNGTGRSFDTCGNPGYAMRLDVPGAWRKRMTGYLSKRQFAIRIRPIIASLADTNGRINVPYWTSNRHQHAAHEARNTKPRSVERHRKSKIGKPEEVAERLQVPEKAHTGILEKCYSPAEIAEAWGHSADTIRKMFENEPGVQIMGNKQSTRHKRRYRTMKIPESVARRVWNRLGSRPDPLKGK